MGFQRKKILLKYIIVYQFRKVNVFFYMLDFDLYIIFMYMGGNIMKVKESYECKGSYYKWKGVGKREINVIYIIC